MIDQGRIDALRDQLRGPVIVPGDAEYDAARALYNGMIDKRPGAIARCADVADVMAAVRFAADRGDLVAIRGGGHSGGGLGSCDGGLVIDLSAMTGIRVDPAACTVRAGPGCTQGAVDHAAHAFGLAVPAGVVSTTGIAGLTLGGGHGYLSRLYGLTIDNLLEADVVLADGRFVTASERENEDLFWALRGGGGNFGVVTSFLYRAHPVKTVHGVTLFWDLARAREIMEWYRDFLPQAPEELSLFLGLQRVPPAAPFPQAVHGRRNCALIGCHVGPPERTEAAMRPLEALPAPLFAATGPMPFPVLQSQFDPLLPPGLQMYWRGDFVRELTDAAIDVHLDFAQRAPTALSTMHLYPIDGAVQRVAPDATAWSHRDVTWSMVIVGIDPDPANAGAVTAWAKGYWEAVHPHGAGAGYVNFLMEEGQERVQATYRDNYERLVAVKRTYDPGNLFRVNQNIRP